LIGGTAGVETVSQEKLYPAAAPGRPDPAAAEDPDHPFKSLYCAHCGYVHSVQLSCGSRVCAKCRRKWFGYHFKALHKLVSTWPVIYSLTLTVQNIPDAEFSKAHVKKIRDDFTRLRSRFKAQLYGGFYVVQATNKGRGWHLHLHIIYDGKFILKQKLVAAWNDITGGSYILDVAKVRDPRRALRYLLADFSGKPRIRPGDADRYDEVFKRSRLVQPFGVYRAYKFKQPFPCPVCGHTCWITDMDLDGRGRGLTEWYDDTG
jgi:hypothetical protein